MAPDVYRRRRPEQTVLFEVIRRHDNTFRAIIEADDGRVEWHTVMEPSSADVAQIAWDTCKRVMRLLKRRGMSMAGDATDELAEREPLLAACYAASVQGFVATGRRAGQRMMQMGVPVADHEVHAQPRRRVSVIAFPSPARIRTGSRSSA